MAKADSNLIIRGLSGMLGGQIVTRQVNGKTVVSTAPPKRGKNVPETQRMQMTRFQQAVAYAKGVLKDDEKRLLYESRLPKGRRVYNAAITDFMKGPEIYAVDTSLYRRTAVKIRIMDLGGSVIEEGACDVPGEDSFWTYTTVTAIPDMSGCRVAAAALDLPGNRTEKEVEIL